MRFVVLGVVGLLLVGCDGAPQQSERVSKDFKVDTLFQKDGCTVYRFADGGYNRYFTNCSGSTEWNERVGRNISHEAGVYGSNNTEQKVGEE